MDKPASRLPLVVGCLLIAVGWAAIYLGWQKAGEQRIEVGQIPYLVSGGFGGLGLILLGVAGILTDVILRASWQQRRAAERVEDALGVVADRLVELKTATERASADEDEPEDEEQPSRRAGKRRTTRSRAGS